MDKAEELEAWGQTGPNAELLALNRTSNGIRFHTITTVAVLLILIDMIWKPDASELPPPSNWNVPLLVHIAGATISPAECSRPWLRSYRRAGMSAVFASGTTHCSS